MSSDIREFHIVAGIDFTDISETVVEHAIDSARRHDRPVLHVATVVSIARSFFKKRDAEHDREELVAVEAELRALVRRKIGDFGQSLQELENWSVHLHARVGQPTEELAALAAEVEADVLIVGRHGERGRVPFFVGSVPERLLKLAACPVMVVQPVDYPLPEPTPDEPHAQVAPRERLPRSAYMTSYGAGGGIGTGGTLML